MNPADEAAVESAQASAEASRTYARGIMRTAEQNYQQFQESAEQALAQRYTIYAKTGNVSTETTELPESGIPVGPTDNPEWAEQRSELEEQIDDLNEQIAALTEQIENPPEEIPEDYGDRGVADRGGGSQADALEAQRAALEEELETAQSSLTALGVSGSELPEIRGSYATGHLSGSDLLTEVSYRDLAQRHGYTLYRNAQAQAAAAVEEGENFDTQADYAEDAAAYNMWTSILGGALKIAGTVAMFV